MLATFFNYRTSPPSRLDVRTKLPHFEPQELSDQNFFWLSFSFPTQSATKL
jgi:hypothetical protein